MKTCIALLSLMLLATPARSQPYDDAAAAAIEILNRSLGSVDSTYRGQTKSFKDDVLARFIAYMAGKDVVKPTQAEVCEAWRALPPDLPFTGDFTVGGVELSFERMCGKRRP